MSEEKALETLKEVASDDFDTLGDDISPKMAQNILNVIEKLQKELEEKTTILLAGAEKVKQLKKEIKELKEKIADLETKLAIEKIDNKYNQEERDEETIPRYKIREKIEEIESFDKAMHQKNGQFTILVLQGLLKEEDGDHIPRID